LVDAAFQLFRGQPLEFILVTAIVYVPLLVVRLALGLGMTDVSPSIGAPLVSGIGGLVAYGLVSGTAALLVRDVYLQRRADVPEALSTILGRLPTLFVATLAKVVLFVIAFICFVVPGFYVMARYFAVGQAVVLEDQGFVGAFRRSSELSNGLKRHILNCLFLLYIILFLINVGIGFLILMLHSRVIGEVIATAVWIVVYPLSGITETLLYYDTRIRKEGFDVELLASLPTTPAPIGRAAT